jgi:nitroreductase
MNAIFNRKSVRKFENKEVENEKLEQLLKAAMAAPSAANQQPWEFYVVKNKETLEALSQSSPYAGCVKGAAAAIVPCYRKEIMMPEYAEIDLSAATQNILLEVEDLGLGAVWIGTAPVEERMEKVRTILNIPENLQAFAVIPVGYPEGESNSADRYDADRVHYL